MTIMFLFIYGSCVPSCTLGQYVSWGVKVPKKFKIKTLGLWHHHMPRSWCKFLPSWYFLKT